MAVYGIVTAPEMSVSTKTCRVCRRHTNLNCYRATSQRIIHIKTAVTAIAYPTVQGTDGSQTVPLLPHQLCVIPNPIFHVLQSQVLYLGTQVPNVDVPTSLPRSIDFIHTLGASATTESSLELESAPGLESRISKHATHTCTQDHMPTQNHIIIPSSINPRHFPKRPKYCILASRFFPVDHHILRTRSVILHHPLR